MKKTITTRELKDSIGELVNAVRFRSDRYIVTQRGKAAAALVPIAVLEKYEQNLRALAEVMERTARANRDTDPDKLERTIAEAIAEARRDRRALLPGGKTPASAAPATETSPLV